MVLMYCLIFLAICINVTAQLCLKVGMQRIGYFEFVPGNIWPIGWRIATSLPIIMGMCCYVLSVVVWMMVLSRVEVSLAYPLSSLGYVLVALAAYVIFGESISAMRMAGIFVVIFGVFLISRS
jgi:multidrug transporter EmrE-like cation transporter